eukprot:TRINITY_DN414_c0_g2_i1.p1 TRINITY_DN414_c0_g2~~TRINITY_DN414_c0_g2_i1.p1  ORF type:complete len:828 (+),score=244.38 TRINITY_DN414_c0_g2_i1:82-2565(+)
MAQGGGAAGAARPHEGWLTKVQGGLTRNRRRYFRLSAAADGAWQLCYYADQATRTQVGALRLQGAQVSPLSPAEFTLQGPQFEKAGKTYHMRGDDAAQAAEWIRLLTAAAGTSGSAAGSPARGGSLFGSPSASPGSSPRSSSPAEQRGRGVSVTGRAPGGAASAAHGVLRYDPAACSLADMAGSTAADSSAAKMGGGQADTFTVQCQGRPAQLRVDAGAGECVLSSGSTVINVWKASSGFSFKKCTDQTRSLELTLRGRALIQDGPLRRVHFSQEHVVLFSSLADREACASLCSQLQTGKQPAARATAPVTAPLRLFIGTWNVGEKAPPDDMGPWLGQAAECNLAVVAAQECNYKAREGFHNTDEDWFGSVLRSINAGLPRDGWFCTVEHVTMADALTGREMRLIVFVKERDSWRVGDNAATQEATGVAHVGGNKGGLCVAMRYMNTPLCFVAAHLAAHQTVLSRRASDVSEIIEGVSGAVGTKGVDVTHEYTHVFWMGDLNYRIDTLEDSASFKKDDPEWYATVRLESKQQVLKLIKEQKWEPLWEDDQLRKAMQRCKLKPRGQPLLFPGFVEVDDPAFPPTFKVIPSHKAEKAAQGGASTEYDTKRVPAWCDRVLYSRLFTHTADDSVKVRKYFSVPSLCTSDHKPVGAVLDLQVRHQWPLHWPPVRGCRLCIQFFNLRAHGVQAADISGTSDPYILFQSSFTTEVVRSSVARRTLSPVWKDVITLTGSLGDFIWLAGEYLTMCLLDWDQTSKDDPIGQAVLCLQGRCDARVHDFDLDIIQYGKHQGRLQGQMCCGEVPPGQAMPPTGRSAPRLELLASRGVTRV